MTQTERKHKIVNGMVIVEVTHKLGGISADVDYSVYTSEEWRHPKGYRYAEYEGCTLKEAIEQAENY